MKQSATNETRFHLAVMRELCSHPDTCVPSRKQQAEPDRCTWKKRVDTACAALLRRRRHVSPGIASSSRRLPQIVPGRGFVELVLAGGRVPNPRIQLKVGLQ